MTRDLTFAILKSHDNNKSVPNSVMISLSQSKVKTFLRCPKKYEYRYIEGLQPKTKSLPLERGLWIHECLQAIYSGKNWKKTLQLLTGKFRRLFDEEREVFGDMPGDVERVITGYLNYWDDRQWEILAVEREFAYRLKRSGLVVEGKIDLVIRDSLGVWIVEHKSNARVPRDAPEIPDLQTTLYNYALRGMGLEGAGTIHNHIRTKPPTEPRVLKRGGGLIRRCDTDYQTYLRAVKRNGFNRADYADILGSLKRKNNFFIRFRVPWKETAVRSMLIDLQVIASLIDRLKIFPRHINRMCKSDCPFFQICMVDLHGGDSTIIKQTRFSKDNTGYG